MTARVRRWSAKTTIAAIYASTGGVLLALALLVAFLLEPPLLGWVGFAVVCAIVLSLATVATIAFPRMRVNPQRPAVALDHQSRLLVVADEHCGSPALWQEIYARLDGAVAVHLVVPVRVSHLHYLTNDEREESRDAEDRARLAIELLRRRGVSVSGGVGSDDPLESMTDALGSFPDPRAAGDLHARRLVLDGAGARGQGSGLDAAPGRPRRRSPDTNHRPRSELARE